MRKLALLFVFSLALGPAWAASAGEVAEPTAPRVLVPAGYEVVRSEALGPGVAHMQLARSAPPSAVNVAWLAKGSPVNARAVLSNDAIAGPDERLERTSAMCIRVRCLAAVNGDFFADATGQPIGAVVTGGELERSPSPKHHELIIAPDGSLATGPMTWKGSVMPTDLRPLELGGVNVERGADQLVLYTHAFGPSTGQNRFGIEVALSGLPAEGLRLGQTAVVRLQELREDGDTPISAGGAVLSGHGRGAEALRDLWARAEDGRASRDVLLRVESTPVAAEAIGGSPILVRDGRRWFADEARDLYRLRHPRTMAGWNAEGDLLLVTVDGRQPGYSDGMTMAEAADLMIALGAVEAINLDGGGSTTFVVEGAVENRPSDRAVSRDGVTSIVHTPARGDQVLGSVERPVAVALALVEPGRAAGALASLNLPRSLAVCATKGTEGCRAGEAVILPPAPEPKVGVAGSVSMALLASVLSVNVRLRRIRRRDVTPDGVAA